MERLRAKLEMIAVKYLARASLYGLDQVTIQDKRLRNAKGVHGITDEQIFFLYDDTLFGSAKDGMVFTEKAIYWREKLGTSQRMDYREIVESTAHKALTGNPIRVLGKNHTLEAKKDYYNYICELKSELITIISVYDGYYKNAIEIIEESLVAFAQNKEYREVIDELNKYQGLFLNQEDKSIKIREVSFEAYLGEENFSKAQEELDFINAENPIFYEKGTFLLEQSMTEQKYARLEELQISAIEAQDFQEAYSLFEQQKSLNIRDDNHLEQIELEIKEGHYKKLNQDREAALANRAYDRAYAILEEQCEIGIRTRTEMEDIGRAMKIHEFEAIEEDRLKAVENEEYDTAFSLLEKQKAMGLKSEYEIEIIRESIEQARKEALAKYHEELKRLVDSEDFLASREVIKYIHEIEPSYSVEKEEILILIYQYKLQEADQAISNLPHSELKAELKEIFDITEQMLYEEIRNAARNKEYDFFEFFPDVWKYMDEYGMSAHDYFALEADLEGLKKTLKVMTGDLNVPNVFGHNFIDLLGFACDPGLGNKKEDLLTLLEEIKDQVNLKEIDNRIGFLEFEGANGEERLKIQEYRLSKLNEKLISSNHFAQIIDGMASQDAYDIDSVSQHMAISRLKYDEAYPAKGEFETLEAYKERCHIFSQEHLEKPDSWQELKSEVERLINLFKVKNARYIPSLSTWIRVGEKQLNLLESLETTQGRLAFYNLYFPIKIPTVKIGDYDSEKERFFMIVDGVIKEMNVPISVAEDFKMRFEALEFSCQRSFEDGLMVDVCIYEFKGERILLPFLER